MYLLLLEPDKDLTSFLKKGLSQEGFSVSSFSRISDIEALLAQKEAPNPYVILLDSQLDGDSAHPLLRRLKEHWSETPILVLSTETSPHYKCTFLDEGADDCMSRPISLEELTARIRVLRRRYQTTSGKQLQYGNTLIDFVQQSAFVGGTRLSLSRKEYEVLRLFMEHPQRVYSKFQILDQVWDVHSDVESNVVEVTIKNLRKKLSEKNSELKVESRRHFGYWIDAPLQAVL
jgi:DNA-binding response OmpR family regulator